jgi:hypothetical protein
MCIHKDLKKYANKCSDAKNCILTLPNTWHTDYPHNIPMCSKLTFKHFCCHGTKACILVSKKLVSNGSSKEETACFMLVSAAKPLVRQVLFWGPQRQKSLWDQHCTVGHNLPAIALYNHLVQFAARCPVISNTKTAGFFTTLWTMYGQWSHSHPAAAMISLQQQKKCVCVCVCACVCARACVFARARARMCLNCVWSRNLNRKAV